MKAKLLIAIAGLFIFTITLSSCGNDAEIKSEEEASKIEGVKKESNTLNVVKLNGSLFSVSSPLESIISFKETNAQYNEEALLPIQDLASLSSKFDKAIYLGMIGADLGYTSVFEQQMKSIELFTSVKTISSSLNLENAVPTSLINRLASNSGNKDSLLVLVSEFYRQSNKYLQKNNRMDDAALILAGGWIESMHLSLDLAQKEKDAVKERIASQRASFINLTSLLKKSTPSERMTDLINDFNGLESIYDEVENTYKYDRTEVDVDSKTTKIMGNTEYNFSDDTLQKLSEKIESIRTKLTTE